MSPLAPGNPKTVAVFTSLKKRDPRALVCGASVTLGALRSFEPGNSSQSLLLAELPMFRLLSEEVRCQPARQRAADLADVSFAGTKEMDFMFF